MHTLWVFKARDGVATDFTSLTKTLYDLHKTHEPEDSKGSPLDQLVVENFDEEQIWQELELQNTAVLKHFETAVSQAALDTALSILFNEEDADEEPDEGDEQDGDDIEEEMRDGDLEDGEGEEPPMLKTAMDALRGDNTDEDSDVDFDVDALEKQAKQKKCSAGRESKPLGPPSEVDDRFFKLSEMESFLDDMDKREGKEGDDDVDYFQDLPSGDEDEDIDLFGENVSSKENKKTSTLKSSRNLKYKDFFDAVDDDPAQTADQSDAEDEDNSMDGMQDEDDDEENEDFVEDEECRQAKEALKRVTFNLPGESDDSEGEEMADIFGGKSQNATKPESKSSFEKRQDKASFSSRVMAEKIQDLEKAAMGEKPWQLTGEVSAQTRPENSLLEVDVAFDSASRMGTYHILVWDDVVRKEKPKEEVFEYKKRLTLDHEKSKLSLAEVYEQEYLKQNQPVPEVKVVSNLPSIAMEEVAPVSASNATLLAPEEVKEKNKAGDVLGDSEKTSTDKKRDRRKKKKVKRIKIQEKEKRQKLKEANRTGENKKQSKAEVAENLKKLTKGGKATLLKDEGKDKALRSSSAFFSQLQDQVKSQIKGAKDPGSKKKKHKELSASKLKL
ncbi:unnamed protein product [Coregonus sp. 'balchen']|nr:unnamed protein product [Coregonus sp. 'balchen']